MSRSSSSSAPSPSQAPKSILRRVAVDVTPRQEKAKRPRVAPKSTQPHNQADRTFLLIEPVLPKVQPIVAKTISAAAEKITRKLVKLDLGEPVPFVLKEVTPGSDKGEFRYQGRKVWLDAPRVKYIGEKKVVSTYKVSVARVE